MEKLAIHPGQLKTQVELFEYTTTKDTTGEAVKTAVSKGKKFVQRKDTPGGEDEEGKLVSLSVAKYIMRYNADVLSNGTKYFIRDQDGDYEINSVILIGPHRNRFIELKCSKRGD
jgi:head-tail adaptor